VTQVIRALYDYEAQSSQELSFSKGDFFHVIGRENDTDWYEACNPALPDARGLVPVAFFQALGKTERDSGGSPQAIRLPDHDSGYSDTSGSGTLVNDGPRMSKTMGKGSGAMVYGIVMYDFAAERPDELEAKAGEAIIVIAQSNPEWFVAKPIGRLGGPGLIPVSFIEIRDMTSGQAVADAQEAVQRAGVPKVEEWKKMAADYKNSSITLGKFEANSQQQSLEQGMERMSVQQGGRQSQQNGQGYVRFLHCVFVKQWLTLRSNKLGNPNKLEVLDNHSQIPISQNPHLNSTPLYPHAYLDTVLLKTNTGSS
jgi:bud emergence protein 1